jgi:hypothetical protein
LVADLGKDEGTLPYLQFVLRQLWEKRDKGTNSLTTETYDGIDGLKGAIGAHADDVFRKLQKQEPELASLAQRILPRLANVSETGAITSRRLPFADFDEPARKLLRKLAEPERRLIVLSSATEEVAEAEIVAEVAHEALLDDWNTLSGWIADRKDFFRLRNKLEADAKNWIVKKHRHDFLIPAGKPLLDAADLQIDALEGEISADLENYLNISFWKDRSRRWTRSGVFAALLLAAIGIAMYFADLSRDLQATNTKLEQQTQFTQMATADARSAELAVSTLNEIGNLLAYAYPVVDAHNETCRALKSGRTPSYSSNILGHANELIGRLSSFEWENYDRFDPKPKLDDRCSSIDRTRKTMLFWLGEPECLGKWIKHVEVDRLRAAIEVVARAPIDEMRETGIIVEVQRVSLNKFEGALNALADPKIASQCRA